MEVQDAMRYRDYLLKLKLFDEYKKQRNKVIYMIRNYKKHTQKNTKNKTKTTTTTTHKQNFFADILRVVLI